MIISKTQSKMKIQKKIARNKWITKWITIPASTYMINTVNDPPYDVKLLVLKFDDNKPRILVVNGGPVTYGIIKTYAIMNEDTRVSQVIDTLHMAIAVYKCKTIICGSSGIDVGDLLLKNLLKSHDMLLRYGVEYEE